MKSRDAKPMNFIFDLQKVNVFVYKRKLSYLCIFLIILSLLFFQCSSHKSPAFPHKFKLSDEERTFLKEFFRDLLFDNDGAYTLYGTKPMSMVLIQPSQTEEEEQEWQKYYDSLSPEEKSKISQRNKRYDLAANYQKWTAIKSRFLIHKT